jgi:hypothetical protein
MCLKKSRNVVFSLMVVLLLVTGGQALAQAPQNGEGVGNGVAVDEIESSQISAASIEPIVKETGRISWSIDGLGTLSSSGTIQVEKPSGATVRKAYLAAASMGLSKRKLVNGDVKIDGVDVTWDNEYRCQLSAASLDCWNHWSDVTSMVKSKIDAATSGRIDFTITEVNSLTLDGEILVVIFDDPNQVTSNTIALLFGAQDVDGDNFAIGLSEPLNTDDPQLILDMSLGISYGSQPSTTGKRQFSEVNVNGTRLTTSAGGQDDGAENKNGSLITVGGLDDSNANPPDPFQSGSDSRIDDELYNLKPFVSNSDRKISVTTRNPSNDDNIFFAGFFFGGATAVVGEGVVLTPAFDTNPLNTSHTVTAFVQDTLGNPITNRDVTFTIVSGPNVGTTQVVQTDANGQASFTYTGNTVGTDVIQASFVNNDGETITSNTVQKTWTQIVFDDPNPVFNPGTCTFTTTLYDDQGNVLPNQAVVYTITRPDGTKAENVTAVSDANGKVTITDTCSAFGQGEIELCIDENGNATHDTGEPTNTIQFTQITLLSFTAAATDDQVTLAWETASELDNEGFNLWRSPSADGQFVKINSDLIQAQGNEITGASYSFVDSGVASGVTYYYKLEDVDFYGVSTLHSPVELVYIQAVQERQNKIFLPIIIR